MTTMKACGDCRWIDVALARVESSQKFQQWQISLMLALQLLVIGKLFFFKG